MVKIIFSNFLKTNSENPISKELSRYLNRIFYINKIFNNWVSQYPIHEEYLRQIPRHLSRFDRFFLKQNLKLLVKITLLLVLLFIPRKLEKNKSVSLIYGLSYEQIYFGGSITRLTEFLLSKKIGLAKSDLFYLGNNRHGILSRKLEKIRICRDIPLGIYHDFFNFGNKLQIIYLISQRLLRYSVTLVKYPIVHQIAQAYVVDEVIFDYLNKNKKVELVDLVATQSVISHIPYIFEKNLQSGSRLMIWYSANSVPINYENRDLERVQINEKIYHSMPLDSHYVWNQRHKDFLDSVIVPPIPVKVRGSLMFYLPQNEIIPDKVYDVIVFDITPYGPTFKSDFNKISFSQNSIFNDVTAIKFVQDVLCEVRQIEQSFGVKLRVALKSKRKYTPLHSSEYLAFLDHLSESGIIDILGQELDLYKIIRKSRMSIVYPFSSPAVIAKELGIPTAYFLSDNSIEEDEQIDGIEFITDRTKLLNFIIKHTIMEQS